MNIWGSDSQSVVSGPTAAASPGNLLEMQIIGSFLSSTESEKGGSGRGGNYQMNLA